MELLKFYRSDEHHMALYRNDEGQFIFTMTHRDIFQRKARPTLKAKMLLDHMENEIYRTGIDYRPVPLLVSRYEGITRYFETPDDLERYYSGLGVDATRAADCLRNNLPVIFGKLTVHREKPWHFNEGVVAAKYGKRSAM